MGEDQWLECGSLRERNGSWGKITMTRQDRGKPKVGIAPHLGNASIVPSFATRSRTEVVLGRSPDRLGEWGPRALSVQEVWVAEFAKSFGRTVESPKVLATSATP